MKIGILQPSYLPWLGYFEQIHRADRFVFYDDVQYTKKDWRNRNRIKTPAGPLWLTVPVRTAGRFTQTIAEVRTADDRSWARKHWHAIEANYRRAPHFDLYAAGLRAFYERPQPHLADFNISLTLYLCACLGLSREFFRSSSLPLREGDRNRRILEVCRLLGSDCLYDGAAARDFLDLDLFRANQIGVEFQAYKHPTYPQLWGEFVPYLSVIDLLFNCGPESLRILTAGQGV